VSLTYVRVRFRVSDRVGVKVMNRAPQTSCVPPSSSKLAEFNWTIVLLVWANNMTVYRLG